MAKRSAKTPPRPPDTGGRRRRSTKPPRRPTVLSDTLTQAIRPELWDPRAPGFDLWAARDIARDPKRVPGLFWPHRQSRGAAWLGIPTFFKLPIALTPEDLKAAKVDVAIFGAPLDMGYGMRGAAFGPQAIRVSERYLSWGDAQSGASRPHQHVRIDPFHVLTAADYGDVAIDPFSTERSVGHVQEFVRGIAETGAIPLMVGGDHSLLWSGAAGVADVYGKGSVGIIHFDARADTSPSMLWHLAAPGTPVRPLLRRLTAENTVVGIDVVEMNPLVDPGYTTALNVNRCIREMLVGLALRKQGIRTVDYLDPRMTGDT